MDLSIIIVNFKTKELTIQAIDSIINTIKNLTYEIIVYDNNSKDGSFEFITNTYKSYENIYTYKNNENLGFAKANNLAIKKSKGDYVLLLNSDTIVKHDCIEKCLNFIKQDETIGALGCKITLPSGELDHTCKRGFPTPFNSLCYFLKLHKVFPNNPKVCGYLLSNLDKNDIHEVDSLVGAFMLLPRKIIDQVGLLDEDFFMYGEDIDWCYRIKKAGYKIIYYPKAEIIHFKGQSSKKKKLKTIYEFNRAMIIFYNKHYRAKSNIIVTFLVYFGIGCKLVLDIIKNIKLKT